MISASASTTPTDFSANSAPIVVGHDGSAPADLALKSAFELAQALSAPIVILRAWSIETAPRGAVFHDGYAASSAEITATVRERLRADTAALVAQNPDCRVETRAVLGQPAEVLVAASETARMLVVGSRGLGGFAGLLLGSVSEQCVRHTHCPVLVTPHGD